MKIKRIIIMFLTIWVFLGTNAYSSKILKKILSERKWEELPGVFIDESYKTLERYFSKCRSLKIITTEGNNLTYKAKFNHEGEIGVISFDYNKKENKYTNLIIKNQIQPLYFIEKFRKYRVADMRLSIGDAQLHFISGYFYETIPFQSLLLFEGKWNFHIKPGDREEQLTLDRIYNKEYFSQTNNSGIFIMPDKAFLKKLTSVGEVKKLNKDAMTLFKLYRNAFGVHIKQYDEYWYLPFPQRTYFVVFKKDKESFYYYSYNESNVPDTRLMESRRNHMILSYNAHQGIKMSFGGKNKVKEMKLNLYFNPQNNFLSGTTNLTYSEPSGLKILELSDGLKITANLDLEAKGINIFRKRETYYLLGAMNDSLSLYFRGYIKPGKENFELFKTMGEVRPVGVSDTESKPESFYFLSKTDQYYPNPGDDFFKSQVTLTLPGALNCLASGSLVEKTEGDPSIYKFASVSSKGVSLVVGDFVLSGTTKAQIPLHFYSPQNFSLPRELDLEDIKECFNFYSHLLGPLDLTEINILLRPGDQEGGISNNGFIIVNYFDKKRKVLLRNKKIISPIPLRDRLEDYIIHELAHQWWGGVISWNSYRDIWITEGLAQFSVLYYLKKKLSEKQFDRLIKKIKRWVYRYSDSGPIIYGARIRSLENRYEPFQSVIYNKTALLFFMVMDLLGEEEFNRKLKSVLEEYRYRSISSIQFIRHFSGENELLSDFFSKWIYSRAIPEVELSVDRNDPAFDNEEFKTVVISIKQLDTDFIFPLRLKVITQKDSSTETVVIKERRQKLIFKRDFPIRAVNIEDWVTPVKEKKNFLPPQNPK